MTARKSRVRLDMAELCHEAVSRFGTDWDLVARYLKERIAAMPTEDRRELDEEMNRVLGFRAPQRPVHMH